jgi:hypothetical protein
MTGSSNERQRRGIIMDIGFRFEVIYKDSDLLEVRVSAWNGAFGGTADVYVGIGQLEETAAKLKGFPKHPSDTREIMLGSFDPKMAGGGASMQFYCTDASGHAYVESKIKSNSLPGKPVQCVILLLPIEAAAVDSFVNELRLLGLHKTGVARLEGAPTAVRS